MVTNVVIVVTLFLVHLSSCFCVVFHSNSTFVDINFAPALATWYGDEIVAKAGGACGLENDVQYPPLSSMISAGNTNIFLSGKGCGNCFQILCQQAPYCSGKPVTVTVTDVCPGTCNNVPFHFDLSGPAFGAMANPGQDHNLRNLGQVTVQYQRVPCNYRGTNIAFKVDRGSSQYWFAVVIEYANGDGGFKSVEIAPGGTQNFVSMYNTWGAVWKIDTNTSFQPPFSFRLTSTNGKSIVASNVIPQKFAAGQKYVSQVNF